jgi:hypothetical protein
VKPASLIIMLLAASASTAGLGQMIQPGKWELVSTPTSIDMPGAPPQVLAMMKGRPLKMSLCITPDQARLGPQALAKASRNCRYTRFDVRGSRIDSQMVCNQPGGAMTVTTTGKFTRTSFVSDGRSVMTGRRRMTTTSHTAGRRVGNCGR